MFRGLLTAIGYTRRAVLECGHVSELPRLLRLQILCAERTLFTSMRLERYCCCAPSLPLDPVHCMPCELAARLARVALHPEHHSTDQHLECIDGIWSQLTAAGYHN